MLEACVLQDDIVKTLPLRKLRKWSSNDPQLVTRLPKHLHEAYEVNQKTQQIKILELT